MKRTVHVLIDDIDGSEGAESIKFSLDGADYTIDLSAANAAALREALRPYSEVAKRALRGLSVPRRLHTGNLTPLSARRMENAAIREWGRTKGLTIADRGRIPQTVVNQFRAEKAVEAA
jgi:hypothetical protein